MKGVGTIRDDGQAILAVAIEKFGVYGQYYAKGHAELGLKVLKEGLAVAKTKWPIALDIAYICRDEKRYLEAIDAFTLELESPGGPHTYFTLSERAKLFDRIGDHEAANRDWRELERIKGPDVLKYERGY